MFPPTEQSQTGPAQAHRCQAGSWRATCGPLTCHKWGSGVLQHSARAVVPPPRLRAKWVVFSAHLRTIHSGPGRGSARRCREVESLRNPAKLGSFRKAYNRAWAAGSSRSLGKGLGFFEWVCSAGDPVTCCPWINMKSECSKGDAGNSASEFMRAPYEQTLSGFQ